MRRFLIALLSLTILLGAASTAQAHAESNAPTAVAHRAIHGMPKLCDRIEWSVYVGGYHKAEATFVQEWNADGYGRRVDGAAVFAQVVQQCKAAN